MTPIVRAAANAIKKAAANSEFMPRSERMTRSKAAALSSKAVATNTFSFTRLSTALARYAPKKLMMGSTAVTRSANEAVKPKLSPRIVGVQAERPSLSVPCTNAGQAKSAMPQPESKSTCENIFFMFEVPLIDVAFQKSDV